MVRPLSTSQPTRNGALKDAPARPAAAPAEALRAAGLEACDGEILRAELDKIAAEDDQVRPQFEREPDAAPEVAPEDALRAENQKLRRSVAELEHLLEQMHQEEKAWASRQKEYEGLLEEKSEVIRELYQKLHEQPERSGAAAPREEELIALSEELERERRQLKDDEEALMEQMRQMEVQMSRERAELARQRNDLQRLQNDIRHELELAARDATLRDRLAPLQRRHQDMLKRTGGPTARPEPAPAAAEEAPPPARKDSSLLRRLFGG